MSFDVQPSVKKKPKLHLGYFHFWWAGTVLRAFWDVLWGYKSSLALTKFSSSFLVFTDEVQCKATWGNISSLIIFHTIIQTGELNHNSFGKCFQWKKECIYIQLFILDFKLIIFPCPDDLPHQIKVSYLRGDILSKHTM